jgi:periplasmic divalent cation tolerance protein
MTPHPDIRVLYIPCGSEADAHALARELIERRLVACANIYRSRSIYMWQGKLADEVEHVIFAKTTSNVAARAAAAAEELHNYSVPCVLVMSPESANERYASWVAGEVAAELPGKVGS